MGPHDRRFLSGYAGSGCDRVLRVCAQDAVAFANGGLSRYERASLYQHIGERVVRLESRAGEADFSPVVQVDGQCLIVPKAVWREHPFDEDLFRDFH